MIYFSSDLHLYHQRALEIMPNRPWKTVDEMNQGLIDNWNSVISNEDYIFVLGDFIMGQNKFGTIPKVMSQLKGKIILLRGNHDKGFSDHRPGKYEEARKLYSDNGIYLVLDGIVSLNEYNFTHEELPFEIKLCHFPPASVKDHVEYEERYASFRPIINDNEVLFCGHCHSKEWRLAPNVVHVGVDAEMWKYKPVSLNMILALLTEVVYA